MLFGPRRRGERAGRCGLYELLRRVAPGRGRDALLATLELACRVGKIARAPTWHRAIGAGGPDEVEDAWITAPVESMISLLDGSYLGRA